jgi:hypothetical protein
MLGFLQKGNVMLRLTLVLVFLAPLGLIGCGQAEDTTPKNAIQVRKMQGKPTSKAEVQDLLNQQKQKKQP